MRGIITIFLAFLMLGCSPKPDALVVTDSDGENQEEVGSAEGYNLSIAALKGLYIDGSHRLSEVAFITGSVTANDCMGEFPNTLILEDESGAIALSVDLDGAFSEYPIGGEVTLNCTDLWIRGDSGTLYLGTEPTSDRVVDVIEVDDLRRITRVKTDGVTPHRPRCVTLAELTPELVSCYIKLVDMRFLPNDEGVDTFCALDPETGRRISTSHTLEEISTAERIKLYLLSTVDYADESLPEGVGDLYCILERYGKSYSVRLVSHRFSFE